MKGLSSLIAGTSDDFASIAEVLEIVNGIVFVDNFGNYPFYRLREHRRVFEVV